jgi:hypothetical protein
MQSNTEPRRAVLTTITALAAVPLASSTTAARSGNGRDGADRCVGVNRRARARTGRGPANRPDVSLAAVDRIVDDRFVVLLVEEDGEVVDQRVVAREELPAVEEGDVLLVVLEEGELIEARPLVGETERRRRWNRDRLDCLLGRVD